MTGGLQSSLDAVRAEERAQQGPSDALPRRYLVRNNAPVPLEPELEHQVLAIAAHTGRSRAEVIQEMVRDRLKGGTYGAPFPFPVKQSGRQPEGQSDPRPDVHPGAGRTDSTSTQRTA